MNGPARPALFLDRDGVLNFDYGYIANWNRFKPVPGATQLIRAANIADWAVIVVTNQSGVARGYFTEDDVEAFHRRMVDHFQSEGGRIDAIYYCPFLLGAPLQAYNLSSPERKPQPGMILRAAADLGLDLSRSALIGDRQSDMAAAAAAGVIGHLFTGGNLWVFAASRLPELSNRLS